MADIVTIREAVVRAKSDGLPITEYMLRNWIPFGRPGPANCFITPIW